MKKTGIFTAIALLTVLFVGCSQIADEAGGIESTAPPTSSFSAGETEETTQPSEEATTVETETSAVSEQPTTPPATNSTAPQDSKPSPSKPDDNKPTQSKPPAETQTPTEPPKPTDPPVTSTPTPVFDPQPYVDYAISYGKSIGLKYEPAIGKGNWNSPVNLYAALTDENMKLGIRSSCDILITEGFEYFWVEAVKNGEQSYRLFVYFG